MAQAHLPHGPSLGVWHSFITRLLNVHEYRETAVIRQSPRPPEACFPGEGDQNKQQRIERGKRLMEAGDRGSGKRGVVAALACREPRTGKGRGGSREAGPGLRGLDFVDCEKQSSLERQDGGAKGRSQKDPGSLSPRSCHTWSVAQPCCSASVSPDSEALSSPPLCTTFAVARTCLDLRAF